ncbi:MAG: DUF4402 domain-containing protein [Sphingorhabdus sp.]|uniref:DUF4402 domain-containing protein n=1 Tax=Sphingorhabdus sp. TaxID=1902408 RepID=UPI003C9E561D
MRHRLAHPFAVISAFAACSSFTCSAAFAQTAVEQGRSQVGVVTPLSFIQTEELHFGQIFASNTAGTVTVAPNGSRTRTGGVTLFGTIHQPAEFAGMGAFNQRVQVSLGSNSIFLTGPGVRMRARTFVIGSTPTAVLTTTPRVFRIGGPTGAFRFPVGATLEVGANQAPGTYRGTWTITLNYQ